MTPSISTPGMEAFADSLLAAIGARSAEIGGGRLTLHWPLVGSRFDHGVLVVGQAVYGWFGDWTAEDALDQGRRGRIVSDARNLFADRPDRMDWLEGNRVWNSPFWRVAREMTESITPGGGPFYNRMAWANLYPVAPNDRKANPAGVLLDAQAEHAPALLASIIAAIDPSAVVVLGGPYVWPFIEPLGLGGLEARSRPLYLAGEADGTTWVVGMHPGGASRRHVGPSQYAEIIVAALGSTVDGERSGSPVVA